ncbi:hypothetical protein EF847_18125 [Actinobacteria bacterium YIM 96077]|uniref:Uncharacterized protein n=1 Tax=Phytoactinopolyspora halophila TaxID=1981511 RepID=A0A329QRN4_9ACTN|nr:hypothetical protein [Phytoactinopolyspora halophila]AYY14330.1 hypothetical protein EF847_18125 [Actinobacteria bacterium YIM 96077]RAW14873.1 hypothetical protein DPM12_10340 [Phytoactinopolyspora halophila]
MGAISASQGRVAVALTTLESTVSRLHHVYGDTLGTRRPVSDVGRLREDLDQLGEPQPAHRPLPEGPLEMVPDTPYDPNMWTGAEEEGLGAPDRHAP